MQTCALKRRCGCIRPPGGLEIAQRKGQEASWRTPPQVRIAASGGDISGAVWTLVFDASTVSASGTGTAAKAQVKTSGGSAHLTGLTVGTSGTDIVLENTSIASGQDVTLSSATITHA